MPTAREQLDTAFNNYEVTVRAVALEVYATILVPYMDANDLCFVGWRQEYHGFYKMDGATILWSDAPDDVRDAFDILYWHSFENHFLRDHFPVVPMPS